LRQFIIEGEVADGFLNGEPMGLHPPLQGAAQRETWLSIDRPLVKAQSCERGLDDLQMLSFGLS
jgi:hypothetical protein